MSDRTIRDLENKLQEMQDSLTNSITGHGSGALGEVAVFNLDRNLNGKNFIYAECLTPCPPGQAQLLKDGNGRWYAISSSNRISQRIDVAQNIRRRQPRQTSRTARVAFLFIAVDYSGSYINTFSHWVIADGIPHKLFSYKSLDVNIYALDPSTPASVATGRLSALANGTVYVDFWQSRLDRGRISYHYQIRGRQVEQLPESIGWRKTWVNSSQDPVPPDLDPCIDLYRGSNVNIQNNQLWNSPDFFYNDSSMTPFRFSSQGDSDSIGIGDIAYLTNNQLKGRVEISNLVRVDGQCLPESYEVRTFLTPKIRWQQIPANAFAFEGAIAY